MKEKKIIVLPAPHCRRSKKIMDFLDLEKIPYEKIDLLSTEGQILSDKHHFMASPGILINGMSLNPYDVLNQKECRVNHDKAMRIFTCVTE
jgi:hypothetical protein